MAAELTIAERPTAPIQRATSAIATDPFEPQNWPELLKFAEIISKTAFAPKDFVGRPEACAIAMLYGRQLGIGGLQAIQNIAVINGRPTVYGDLFWAIIISHPEFQDVVEKTGPEGAEVKLTRRGRTPKIATFTPKDAQLAGLWGKAGPWSQYPANQMLWRARTIAGRALFADALKGLTSSQEAEDFQGVTVEGDPASDLKDARKQANESAPKLSATPDKITQDQAREFAKAWKQSGYQIADAKAALKSIANVDSSLEIPGDKYEAVMRWATKNPAWPAASEPPSRDEELCRELFGILNYDMARQAQAIEESNGDWTELAKKLNAELPVE